jgi:hypothetical protein
MVLLGLVSVLGVFNEKMKELGNEAVIEYWQMGCSKPCINQ